MGTKQVQFIQKENEIIAARTESTKNKLEELERQVLVKRSILMEQQGKIEQELQEIEKQVEQRRVGRSLGESSLNLGSTDQEHPLNFSHLGSTRKNSARTPLGQSLSKWSHSKMTSNTFKKPFALKIKPIWPLRTAGHHKTPETIQIINFSKSCVT